MAKHGKLSRNLSLLAVVAVVGASIVLTLGGSSSATTGNSMILGVSNGETSTTYLVNGANDSVGLYVEGGPGGTAVIADSDYAYGVIGTSYAGVGVLGDTTYNKATCCAGFTLDGVHGIGKANGVSGETTNDGASGVYGVNNGAGYGVAGRAVNGTGVLADSANGVALFVSGKAQFTRSGVATINGAAATPKSSIRVSNVALSAKSFVLTTPQTNLAGVSVQAAVPNVANSYVTIFLNKAVTTPYKVAWMIVERP